MTKMLFKKMCRDVWRLRAQFLSILMMCFVGMLIYAGIEGVWHGMQVEADAYFKETRLADIWVTGQFLDSEDVREIEKIKKIDSAQLSVVQNAYLDYQKNRTIQLVANDKNQLSKPKVISGKSYDADGPGIWLDKDYAAQRHVHAGDTITLYSDGRSVEEKVSGLIYHPKYINYTGTRSPLVPDHAKDTYGLVSPDTLNRLTGRKLCFNQIQIKTAAAGKAQTQLKSDIRSALGDKYTNSMNREEVTAVSAYLNKIQQIKKMSVLFSIIFFLLALLTIYTTMKRIVWQQRPQIGVLKALGFTNFQIKAHYALYGLTVSSLGAALGRLAAPYTVTPVLLNLQKEFYSMPRWRESNTYYSIAIIFLIVGICTLAAWLSSRSIVREMPAESLRNEMKSGSRQVVIEKIPGLWKALSFDWRWALRDMAKNKTRTLIGIIGVLGSMVLLMASFGLQDTITITNRKIYGAQYSYYEKIKVAPTMTPEQKAAAERLLRGEDQWASENGCEIQSGRAIRSENVFVFDTGFYLTLRGRGGRPVKLPDHGALLSRRAATELGVQKNDTINVLAHYQQIIRVRVAGIVEVPSPQGVYLSKKAWEATGSAFVPNELLIGKNKNIRAIEKMPSMGQAVKLNDQLADAEKVLKSVQGVVILLLAAAVVLSVVILYNLGLLNFAERYREYATLRVLGATDSEIRQLILKNNGMNIVIGWVLGVVAGYQFLGVYVKAISTSTTVYSPYLSAASFMMASTISMGCAFLVNLLVAGKAARLDMVESLKSVE